jgi:hypothetical protein
VLLGSGLVGGEGLLGVAIAAIGFFQSYSPGAGDWRGGVPLPLQFDEAWLRPEWQAVLGVCVFGLLVWYFARRGLSR